MRCFYLSIAESPIQTPSWGKVLTWLKHWCSEAAENGRLLLPTKRFVRYRYMLCVFL